MYTCNVSSTDTQGRYYLDIMTEDNGDNLFEVIDVK